MGVSCAWRRCPSSFFPDIEAAERFAAESSRTTHGAQECLDASRLLARILVRALAGQPKEEVVLADRQTFQGSPKVVALAREEFLGKPPSIIRGSGYVVECLEAALWCFVHSDDFREAVLLAANLGEDADTTAAVCGQVTRAYYGESAIPSSGRTKLALYAEIVQLADRLRVFSTPEA